MKEAAEKIIRLLSIVIRLFFRYRMINLWRSFKRTFYSHWISYEFANCGKDSKFDVFDFLVGADRMSFGSNVIVGSHVSLEVYGKRFDDNFDGHFSAGDNSHIGQYCHISCTNQIQIGKNCVLGRRVFITDNSHGMSSKKHMDIHPSIRPIYSKGLVVLEDNVWIGEAACILPGVTIGQGSIIGANAVVTKSIPAYCVAAGNPAKIIKQL